MCYHLWSNAKPLWCVLWNQGAAQEASKARIDGDTEDITDVVAMLAARNPFNPDMNLRNVGEIDGKLIQEDSELLFQRLIAIVPIQDE